MTALLITTDDKFETVKCNPKNGLKDFYENIGCNLVQVVMPYGLQRIGLLGENYIMVVDEEGLLKDEPKLNVFASTFYGSPIYGNAMIVKENEEDFEALTEEDHREIRVAIAILIDELETQYK